MRMSSQFDLELTDVTPAASPAVETWQVASDSVIVEGVVNERPDPVVNVKVAPSIERRRIFARG
jgi:hypothetical protein